MADNGGPSIYVEKQYRWCDETGAVVGYQHENWKNTSCNMFLFDDMVFPSAVAALEEIALHATQIRMPPFITWKDNATHVLLEIQYGADTEEIMHTHSSSKLICKTTLPSSCEEEANAKLLQVLASTLDIDAVDLRLDWDSTLRSAVLIVPKKNNHFVYNRLRENNLA